MYVHLYIYIYVIVYASFGHTIFVFALVIISICFWLKIYVIFKRLTVISVRKLQEKSYSLQSLWLIGVIFVVELIYNMNICI